MAKIDLDSLSIEELASLREQQARMTPDIAMPDVARQPRRHVAHAERNQPFRNRRPECVVRGTKLREVVHRQGGNHRNSGRENGCSAEMKGRNRYLRITST